MSTIPPTDTPMGRLSLHEVYISYDGPRLFACRNRMGTYFFGLYVDEDDEYETFIYAPASAERFRAVRAGQIALRSAFESPPDDGVFVVRSSLTEPSEEVTWLPVSEVPDDWYPDDDARLAIETPTEPALTETELEQEASATLRSIAAFELGSQYATTSYSLRSLGEIMQHVQETVDALGQVVEDKKTNRGAVQKVILDETELAFQGVRAASFAFLVTPAQPQDRLIEHPLPSQTLHLLLDLMDAASEPEQAMQARFADLHPRALSKYRDLLEALEDDDTELSAKIASPFDQEVRSSHLSRSGIASSLALVRAGLQDEVKRLPVEAILVGVNVRTHVFELFDEREEQKYSGKAVKELRGRLEGLTTGLRYHATLIQETELLPATGETRFKYRLESIDGPI